MIEPVMNPSEEEIDRWHRTLAPRAFNDTWKLLDLDELTPAQEEEMLSSTFAQRYHWYQVGEPKNWAVADWQVSRVAAVLGYADLAGRYGQLSLDIAEEFKLDAFVKGFAHEAIARAAADVDDLQTFNEHLAAAKAELNNILDPEERQILEADLIEMSEE